MVRHHLDHARNAPAGCSAETVYGGHEYMLCQIVIALRAGRRLDDHDNLCKATVQVLEGRILLESRDASWSGWRGDLLTLPLARNSLEALEEAVILLQSRSSSRQRNQCANVQQHPLPGLQPHCQCAQQAEQLPDTTNDAPG
jgi:hypothetical protein